MRARFSILLVVLVAAGCGAGEGGEAGDTAGPESFTVEQTASGLERAGIQATVLPDGGVGCEPETRS
jgi:hypothetical protein